MRQANDEVMLIAQIENADGVEHADAIAAVDGIDALWIGQYDLTTSLGIPGQFDHPLLPGGHPPGRRGLPQARQDRRAGRRRRRRSFARGPADGFRMLVYLADIWIYQQGLRQGLRRSERSRQQAKPTS